MIMKDDGTDMPKHLPLQLAPLAFLKLPLAAMFDVPYQTQYDYLPSNQSLFLLEFQKIMWKLNKSIAKELLPIEPVEFVIEPWWGVCLVNFTLEEFKVKCHLTKFTSKCIFPEVKVQLTLTLCSISSIETLRRRISTN